MLVRPYAIPNVHPTPARVMQQVSYLNDQMHGRNDDSGPGQHQESTHLPWIVVS
jgi:hypothetical protein